MGAATSRLRSTGAFQRWTGRLKNDSEKRLPSATSAEQVDAFPGLQRWRVGPPSEAAALVRHILVDEESVAQRIQQELSKSKSAGHETLCEHFEQLARRHSRCPSRQHGGLLDWVRPRETTRRFDQAVFEASRPAGTIDVVQSEYGWHVIWILERQEVSSSARRVPCAEPTTARDTTSMELSRPSAAPPDPEYLQLLQQVSSAIRQRPMPNVVPSAGLFPTRHRVRSEPPLTHAQALSVLIAHRLEPETWTLDALTTAFGIADPSMKALLAKALQTYRPWAAVLAPDGMRHLRELS